jgi:hypothetical protein
MLSGSWRPMLGPTDVALAGNLIYIASAETGFLSSVEIVDVSNPQHPVLRGYYDTLGNAGEIVVHTSLGRTIAYIADGENGLLLLDVTNPATPLRLSGFDTKGSVDHLRVDGSQVFFTDGKWLVILDISEPAHPYRVGRFEAERNIAELAVSSGLVYLALESGELQLLDVGDPQQVKALGKHAGWGGLPRALATSAPFALLARGAAGLHVLDCEDPSTIRWVTSHPATVEDVAVVGTTVAIAAGTNGLKLLELQRIPPPALQFLRAANDTLTLSWRLDADFHLQRCEDLLIREWRDIPGTDRTNSVTLPMTDVAAFFRLSTRRRPESGLVAWWNGEGDGQDSAGSHHGTLQNGASFAAGRIGQAFAFDGQDDFVEVPDDDRWAFANRDFTVELWALFHSVRTSDSLNGADFGLIASDDGHGWQSKWALMYVGRVLTFHICSVTTGPVWIAQHPFTPQVNRWYHIAVTRSGDLFTIYLDGVPVASERSEIAVPDASTPLTIGQLEYIGFMHGLLDEVSIYDRALTAGEISNISSTGAKRN